MATISPSDVVSDVVRTTAPVTIGSARARFADHAPRVALAGETFAVSRGPASASSRTEGAKIATPESFKRFEAMVLQTFIQNMLPRDGAAVYGKGVAGDMWKSLLAEKVADSLADRGGIGISDRVLGEHYGLAQDNAVPEAASASKVADGETAAPVELSPALIEDIMRRLSDSIVQDLFDSTQRTTDRG